MVGAWKDTHPFVFWIGIVLLIVLVGVLAGGSVAPRGESALTPTPVATATIPATRRVAYWVSSTTDGATRELRVLDVTAPDHDTTLATLLHTERGAAAVWSSDRTDLVLVVEWSSPGTGEASGPFSALRVVDTPTRSIHEIARVTDGSQYWPAGWDRVAHLVGACVYGGPDAMAIAWVVVGEDGLSSRVPTESGIPATTIRANGTDVLCVLNGSVVRVWTLASCNDHREFGAASGERIALARWKPGADEIVVLVADRLEIWPKAGGDRRIVARGLPAASDILASPTASSPSRRRATGTSERCAES